MIVLDTNHVSALAYLGSTRDRLMARLEAAGQDVGITIITVQETIKGWMAEINKPGPESSHIRAYEDLRKLILGFTEIDFILPFDTATAAKSEELKQQFPNMKAADRRIAAIVLCTEDCLLLTRNVKHFENIPGLRYENWIE